MNMKKETISNMKIQHITVGALEVNCYFVWDDATKKAMIIDPGDEPDRIMEWVKDLGLKVEYIVLTHAHFDHVGALPELKALTGAKIVVHQDEMNTYNSVSKQGIMWGFEVAPLPKPDILVKEGDEIKIGDVALKVIHTPGHTPGCMCLYGSGALFSGDTLFQGSVGRTDFPGGDSRKLRESFKRLMALPDDTKVYPGHMGATTIGIEKVQNFFAHEF